jgi:RNA-directed DNA polymerase
MSALTKHTHCRWTLLDIKRWLNVPTQLSDGSLVVCEKGAPQGGVIGPLLKNLFMHYAFDKWMRRTINNDFARLADDTVIHCRSRLQAAGMITDGLFTKAGSKASRCLMMQHY